jgi:hypothetical protein
MRRSGSLVSLVDELNDLGIFIGGPELGLTEQLARLWGRTCDAYLRDNGYSGGSTAVLVRHHRRGGNIYLVYDKERWTVTEATRLLDWRP